MTDENFIRNQIRRILVEKSKSDANDAESDSRDEKNKTKGSIAKVKPGRGRVKAEIREAEALANADPGALMTKLKINSAPGNTTLQKVAFVLNRAITTLKSTKGLETAYDRVAQMKSADGVDYLQIIPKDLSPRDALLYMNHTLVGAVNAGILSELDKLVVPEIKGGKVIVKFQDT